jgi:hypothetical protein
MPQPNTTPAPTTPTGQINTAQPNPQTTTINPPNTTTTPGGTTQATPEQVAAVAQATKQVQDLSAQYKQGLANAKASGATAPDLSGAASSATQAYIPPPTQGTPTTTPNVDNHFDPNTNPNLQQSTQDIIDFLNPPNVRNDLITQMSKIQGEQKTLAQQNLELMNIKNVMSGTADDLRSEIQASGGLGTESQVMALTTARNSTLLKQATFLQDQMQYQQSLVANDTQLLNFEKDMANTQATQRMGILQYQQTAQNNILNAARDTYKTLLSTVGASGLYQSLAGDPQQLSNAEQILGVGQGGLQKMASQPDIAQQLKQAQLQGALLSNQKTGLEIKNLQDTSTTTAPPPDPTSNSILAATGMSIPAFYVLTGQSSNLPRDAATRKAAMAEAGKWANAHGVDISTLGSQYKAQNDVLDTNIQRAANTKVFAGEVAGSADALIAAIDQKDLQPGLFGKMFGISNFKPTNLVSLATGKQVNDALTMKYATQLQAMTNDYAGYLAAARGAKSPELADINDAAKVVANGLNSGSTQAFKESIQLNEEKVAGVVDRAVQDAQKSVWNLFGVNKPGANTQTAAPRLLQPTEVPSGYYQASDGLLYKK